MSLADAWAWTALDSTAINSTDRWSMSSVGGSNVVTDQVSVFAGPTGFSPTQYNCRVRGGHFIESLFPASQDKGWFVFRWKLITGGLMSWNYALAALRSGGTNRVYVISSTNNVTNSTVNLYVNGTFVGTSTTAIGQSEATIAIKFDVGAATAAAALWINGTQEVGTGGNLVNGTGGSQTVDRVHFLGATGGSSYVDIGDYIVYNALTDDGARTGLHCLITKPTDDVLTTNWTSTGANFFGELDDFSAASYAQSTTDPTGNLQLGLEERSDIDAGWAGGAYDGVVSHFWAAGDGLLQDATLGIDSNGTPQTTAATLSLTGDIHVHVSETNPDTASAWDGAGVDALTTIISVT